MTEANWKKVQPQIHDILAFTQTLGYLHCFHPKDIQLLLEATTKHYLWHTTIPFESKHLELTTVLAEHLKRPKIPQLTEPHWVLNFIKDASLLPSAEEYSEDFAGFPVLSLLDLFSGYDQMALAEICRDLTAFQTPLGLLRMTTLPQGYTNGVQVFDRVMKKILKDQISAKRGKPFINDVGVKPPTRSLFLDSSGKPIEVAPGIRRYILEAIVSIDKVMADIERAGGTISGAKSEF